MYIQHTVQTYNDEGQCYLTKIFGEGKYFEFVSKGRESNLVFWTGKLFHTWSRSPRCEKNATAMGFAVEALSLSTCVSDEEGREREGLQ